MATPLTHIEGEPFARGSLSHRILVALSMDHVLTLGQIKKMASIHLTLSDLKSIKMFELEKRGYAKPYLEDEQREMWSITDKGLDVKVQMGDLPAITKASRTTTAKRSEVMKRPPYDGNELGPTCQRTGAYDAYALPSRMGKALHYRDGRIEKVTT